MDKACQTQYKIKDGIADGIPLFISFLPIAMAFGILSKTTGILMWESIFFSAFVFAGASQFVALNLFVLGVGTGEIILTTLLLNFRHFLMGASLSTKISKNIKRWYPVIAFGITDETFSVASFKEGEITKKYMLSLELTAYTAWVGGTAIGFMLGRILPDVMQESMSVALYAMFAAILIPEIKKSIATFILAVMSAVINTICVYILDLPQGWSIVISIITISLLGVFFIKEEVKAEYE